MRTVTWLPSSEMSATTTAAPSRAKARAVARPIPLAAPVTNATRPTKLPVVLVSGITHSCRQYSAVGRSGVEQGLDREDQGVHGFQESASARREEAPGETCTDRARQRPGPP